MVGKIRLWKNYCRVYKKIVEVGADLVSAHYNSKLKIKKSLNFKNQLTISTL